MKEYCQEVPLIFSDVIIKVLEFSAKHAWSICILAAFILFLPSEALDKMGLSQIRNETLGIWWILFIFTGALWIGQLTSGLRTCWKKKAKVRIIKKKMLFLSEPEKDWVRYCLYTGEQTATARLTNSVPQSLVNKGILHQGEGHAMSLPFHFDDDAWSIARDNIFEFLSPEELDDPNVGRKLKELMREMHWY